MGANWLIVVVKEPTETPVFCDVNARIFRINRNKRNYEFTEDNR